MTRKLLLGMIAAVALLTTSCSSNDVSNPREQGDCVTASFTIVTPEGIMSRAVGDGTQADKVACAIFHDGSELPSLRQIVDVKNKVATYSVRLTKGQTYKAVFFAYNAVADAYDVTNMEAITLKDSQSCNAEARDAFTASVDVVVSDQTIEQNVTLYRPFAQLNIGSTSDDYNAAKDSGFEVTKTMVTVSNVYTCFNAVEDKVVGTTTDVTYSLADIPAEKLKVVVDGTEREYVYLALNYLLVGDKKAEKALTNVEFTWQTADGKTGTPAITFTNVPVQRNYRTNIVGNVLSYPATFNIVVEEEFDGDKNVEI